MILAMIAIAMVIIVLYHIIFIVVDMRKIVRRVQETTGELQSLILKPVSVADQVMDYVLDLVKKKHRDGKSVDHKKS